MAWVVGKWACVDGSGSKVLFAQMECSWVLGISSKFPINKTRRNKVFAWLE